MCRSTLARTPAWSALAIHQAQRYPRGGPGMSKYAALEWRALLRKLDRQSRACRN